MRAASMLDALGQRCNFRVRVHMRSIDGYTGAEVATEPALRVFGQYGIALEIVSTRPLGLSQAQRLRFREISTSCVWQQVSPEADALYRLGREGVSEREIVVYTVYWISGKLAGCGAHWPGRPAALVSAVDRTPWTLAHELGHVLLGPHFRPVHVNDLENVMNETTRILTRDPPGFTYSQLDQIKNSFYCDYVG